MKIIHSDKDFNFKSNEVYLLSKSGNKYVMIITDEKGKPSYPFTKECFISFSVNKDNIEENSRFSFDEITFLKPHFNFDKIDDNHLFIKISDNIINAISNSYKKVDITDKNKTFVLGVDNKPVEIETWFKKEINIIDNSITGIKNILYIPVNIENIEDNVFSNMNIDIVVFNNKLKNIGHNTFINNNITEVNLPIECSYFSDSFDENVKINNGKLIK